MDQTCFIADSVVAAWGSAARVFHACAHLQKASPYLTPLHHAGPSIEQGHLQICHIHGRSFSGHPAQVWRLPAAEKGQQEWGIGGSIAGRALEASRKVACSPQSEQDVKQPQKMALGSGASDDGVGCVRLPQLRPELPPRLPHQPHRPLQHQARGIRILLQ